MRSSPAETPSRDEPGFGGDAAWQTELSRRGTVFNSPEWARVVAECYGFADCTARSGDASLPLFCSSSPLFGRKLASAVFNSYASPLYRDESECIRLLALARDEAERRRTRMVEIKSLFELPAGAVDSFGLIQARRYKLTVVPLAPYGEMWGRYPRNFRSHLRKARNRVERAGIRIERTLEPRDLRAFHDLMVRRYQQKHLMIGQPRKLFELIQRHFLAHGRGDLWIARFADGALAGGLLVLTHGAIATACFGASRSSCQHLSIDALLKDETMRFYGDGGLKVYDLGISSPKQVDLLFAKSRFGGVTIDLPYYYLLLGPESPPRIDFSDAYMWLRRPFRHLPAPISKLLSSILVRYLN